MSWTRDEPEDGRPLTYDHNLNLLMPVPERDYHRLGLAGRLSIEDNAPCSLHVQPEWQINPFHDHDVVGASHVANIHTPHDLTSESRNSFNLQPVSELHLVQPGCSSTALNEDHGNPMWLNFYSTHDLGQWNAAPASGHIAVYPSETPYACLTSSNQQPLLPLLDHQSGVLWDHSLDQSMTYPSTVCSSSMVYSQYQYPNVTNDENAAKPSTPRLPDSDFPVTSTGHPETAPSHPSVCRVSHRGSTGSSRRGRAARAIGYDELWIDEEELLKGLTEPEGKLNLHQCRWEEDQSSCYLWIRGDKSCINTHIQKWHGGKPGGEKTLVKCRWSGCGKTMLKESIARHIISIHMDEVWECQGCGKLIARNDAYGRHAARSDLEECQTSGALITYSSDARVIDARAALDNGGGVRYASE